MPITRPSAQAGEQLPTLARPAADSQVSPRVVARLAVAGQAAERNTQAMIRRLDGKEALLSALLHLCQQKHLSKAESLRRLRRLADAWAAEVMPSSACRHQCSHCCHVAVAVFESEAKAIATEIKQSLPAPEHDWSHATKAEFAAGFGQPRPCVFLRDGRCAIYAHRPLACRVLFNMDDDEFLCDLAHGTQVSVPHADASGIHLVTAALFFGDRLADIRDWFRDAKSPV